MGLARCQVCSSGDQVRRLAAQQGVGCVVCGPHLSDGPVEWLIQDLPPSCSVLLIGQKHQLDLCSDPDLFKLTTPLRREETVITLRLLLQFTRKMERHSRSSRTVAQQQLVDKAKRRMMERWGIDEEEAHRRIQKQSMDDGARLEQTARKILTQLELEA